MEERLGYESAKRTKNLLGSPSDRRVNQNPSQISLRVLLIFLFLFLLRILEPRGWEGGSSDSEQHHLLQCFCVYVMGRHPHCLKKSTITSSRVQKFCRFFHCRERLTSSETKIR